MVTQCDLHRLNYSIINSLVICYSLGELITSSPPTLCYNLWQGLYSPLLEHIRSVEDEMSYRRCLAYAEIIHTIMYNMKVYDCNVPLTVRSQVSTYVSV